MPAIVRAVPAQNNMSRKCFIALLHTAPQTERSDTHPWVLPQRLRLSPASLLRWKVASARGISCERKRGRHGRPHFSCQLDFLVILSEAKDLYSHRPCSPERCSPNPTATSHPSPGCKPQTPTSPPSPQSASRSACPRHAPPWSQCESAPAPVRPGPPAWWPRT